MGQIMPKLRTDAPCACESRSKTATESPRRAAAQACPRPTIPAPTTATSYESGIVRSETHREFSKDSERKSSGSLACVCRRHEQQQQPPPQYDFQLSTANFQPSAEKRNPASRFTRAKRPHSDQSLASPIHVAADGSVFLTPIHGIMNFAAREVAVAARDRFPGQQCLRRAVGEVAGPEGKETDHGAMRVARRRRRICENGFAPSKSRCSARSSRWKKSPTALVSITPK